MERIACGTADEVRMHWQELCELVAYLASDEARVLLPTTDPAVCRGIDRAHQIAAQRASELAEALCPDDIAPLLAPGAVGGKRQ